MAKDSSNASKTKSGPRKTAPVRTPEAQEQLMINLSMKQAEQMLRDGRAPAQIVVHFLKLATEKAKYENEKLKAETEMAISKSDLMKSQQHSEELYAKAIEAFKSYGGGSSYEEEDDYYDED